ncbi:MAG TPA: hypothetical protein ENN03_04975 [bacterium]|nr:hypothetical protein [bacterium]
MQTLVNLRLAHLNRLPLIFLDLFIRFVYILSSVSTSNPIIPSGKGRSIWPGSHAEAADNSSVSFFGLPLVHIAFGKDEQGRRRIAKGIIAIGQFGIGLITIAQVGIGVIFGFGQVIFGLTAVAQVAVAVIIGIGQLAAGYVAAGQLVLAYYGLGQAGLAVHGWFIDRQDMEVARFLIDCGRKLGFSLEWLFPSG